ncbi:MAG: type II toxin-antitoxin system HicB family antitoxin [Planctomycetota bacterium]
MVKKQKETKELKSYTISDGQMVLTLEEAEEGGFIVRSPSDPELITQAETIEEAFYMARDAAQALHECRVDLLREIRAMRTAS